MTRTPGTMLALSVATVVAVAGVTTACTKPVGSEGGPCTAGGACDPGLSCLSSLCVNDGAGAGEGEGEGGCQGDEPATNDRGDCGGIPALACAPADQNIAVSTCDVAGAILRSGLFQSAFECMAAIEECPSLQNDVDDCFAALTACPLEAADTLCTAVGEQCVSEGDNGFPVDTCQADLISTNQAFRSAYAACFNAAIGTACSDVHDGCYNTALNTLVDR